MVLEIWSFALDASAPIPPPGPPAILHSRVSAPACALGITLLAVSEAGAIGDVLVFNGEAQLQWLVRRRRGDPSGEVGADPLIRQRGKSLLGIAPQLLAHLQDEPIDRGAADGEGGFQRQPEPDRGDGE